MHVCTLRPAMANLFWFYIIKYMYLLKQFQKYHMYMQFVQSGHCLIWVCNASGNFSIQNIGVLVILCAYVQQGCVCQYNVSKKNWLFGALPLENLLLSLFYYIITELHVNSLQCGLLCCRDPLAPFSNSFGSLQDNEWLNLLTNEIYEQVITSLTDKVHK